MKVGFIRAVSVLVLALLIGAVVFLTSISIAAPVSASPDSMWTQTTDSEFNTGSFFNVSVTGSDNGASLKLSPLVYEVDPTLDGQVEYLNGVYNSVDTSGSGFFVGENLDWQTGDYRWYRGFARFQIPVMETVSSTKLYGFVGSATTFNDGEGDCLLHHIEDIGSTLDNTDWNKTVETDFGVFVSGAQASGSTSVNVTTLLQTESQAGENFVSFRFKGSIEDNDSTTTRWGFSSGHLELTPTNMYENYGTYESEVYDSENSSVDWGTISWTADVPAGTELKFKIATDAQGDGPWYYKGPDGDSSTYYTISGTEIPSTHDDKRYIKYKAYLSTTDNTKSPTLDDVTLTYSVPGGPSSTSLTITSSSFTLQASGSRTLTATLTSAGSPVSGKTITWSETAGSLSATSSTTDSNGQASITYTAPSYETEVTVTAFFAGGDNYQASSGYSYGTITLAENENTTLTVTPSSFTVYSKQTQILIATLKDNNDNALAGKTISWSATAGSLSSITATTDTSGQVSVIYTAPTIENQTLATIAASFAGDAQYEASSDNSFGTVSPFQVTFTFQKPDGTSLIHTTIYWGTTSNELTSYLGNTGSQGRITSYDGNLANKTIYLKSSDGTYVGSTYVSSSSGEVIPTLADTRTSSGAPSEFLIWAIAAVVVVAIGVVILLKKRR